MIHPNDRVKIVFKNGMVEEGLVVSWSDDTSVIQAFQSVNQLVIPDTKGSVQAVKVYLEPETEPGEPEPEPGESEPVFADLPMEPDRYYQDENERVQNLVELRAKAKQIELERARKHMTNFSPSADPGLTSYDYPSQPSKSVPVSATEEDRARPAGYKTGPFPGRRNPHS